jgi:hypothetical protein
MFRKESMKNTWIFQMLAIWLLIEVQDSFADDSTPPIVPPTASGDPAPAPRYRSSVPRPAIKCNLAFSKLKESAEAAVIKAKIRRSDYSSNLVADLVGKTRDRITQRLQIWHGHRVPVTSLEDTTPVDSWAFAKHAYGNLPQEQIEKLPNSIEDIMERIVGNDKTVGLLPFVESYPKRLKEHLNETASLGAELDALRALKTENFPRSHNLGIEIPEMKFQEDGSLKLQMRNAFFESRVAVELRIKEIEKMLKNSTFSYDQVHALEDLENFMQQIRREMSLRENRGKKLSPEIAGIYNRMMALYKNGEGIDLKEQYRVPRSAWNQLKAKQFWGELKSVAVKDVPEMQDKIKNNELLAFLNSLSAEDRKAIGLDKIASTTSFLGKTKWAGLATYLTAGAGGTYSLTYPIEGLYKFLRGDQLSKEACADEINDSKFAKCLYTYLQTKFPSPEERELLPSLKTILDPNGKISNSKVKEEIRDAIKIRKETLSRKKFSEDYDEAANREILELMREGDVFSEKYRARLLQISDQETFVQIVLGNSEKNLESYVKTLFPLPYEQNRALVEAYFKAEHKSDEQRNILEQLRKEDAKKLADWLEDLLIDREYALIEILEK